MVSWNKNKAIDDWNKKYQNDRKEGDWSCQAHVQNRDGPDQGKWARTDDGNQQGWTTGTDKNPQANCAPQHGGSSGAYRDSAAPAANEGLTIPMSSDCQPCEKMHMRDWWSSQALYYILPNRVYFFLGAQEIDSEGEYEWYMFLDLLFPTHSPLEIGA